MVPEQNPFCHPELVEGSWQRSEKELPASVHLHCQDASTPHSVLRSE